MGKSADRPPSLKVSCMMMTSVNLEPRRSSRVPTFTLAIEVDAKVESVGRSGGYMSFIWIGGRIDGGGGIAL